MRRTFAAVILLGLAAAARLDAAAHVRVVLDLSQSMRKNDPGRLAILSTVLLFDLVRPNPTLGDSFEIIPFARNWQWSDRNAPPPTDTGPRISARFDRRADLIARLRGLRYDAAMTYFYPGLRAAIEDLEQTRGGAYDVRTVILITDGVPEPPTRAPAGVAPEAELELKRIQNELAPRLAAQRIRLYVLAFGGEADRHRDFFGKIVRDAAGTQLGEYFVDPLGQDLLSHMLQIFSGSFGFTADTAHRLPGTSSLDLDASTTPERVAVVVLSPRAPTPPRLQLTPPPGGTVNHHPEGVRSAGEPGGSYSLAWVLSPNPGDYGLDSDAIPGSVAVLRPTRLTLEVLPAPPLRQTERAIAKTPFPLLVRVRSPSGASGDPGAVDLSFRTLGSRVPGATGQTDYAWTSDSSAPPPGQGTLTPRGREYAILPEWQENPVDRRRTYAGFLEVEARRGGAVVGKLVAEHAHRVEVHPLLSIVPFPLSSYLAKQALGRRDRACTSFELTLNAGQLPHLDQPRYGLRAVLVARDPAVPDRELHQAVFTLDGQPVDFAGRPATPPSPWSVGRTLDGAKLLGQHELCVQIGKPTAADPARAVELPLRFTLQEDPYDEFGVIRPYTVKARIAPPTFFQRWELLLLALLVLLVASALLWYARDRPDLPDDLGYALASEGSVGPLSMQPTVETTAGARLLGLPASRRVLAAGENRFLGRIQAIADELYRFRPSRGVTVESIEPGREIPWQRGAAILAVQRTYRLRTPQRSYHFRLGYR